jgi:hypothetical protein
MIYSRINLSKTHYRELDCCQLIQNPDINQLNTIYQQYCRYKQFESVMPLFENDYRDSYMDILGYYDPAGKLAAFSLVRRQDPNSVEAIQFAWNYQEPRLRLGIRSLENECARYKRLGYYYLYLGFADDYKQQFAGFETLGPAE